MKGGLEYWVQYMIEHIVKFLLLKANLIFFHLFRFLIF